MPYSRPTRFRGFWPLPGIAGTWGASFLQHTIRAQVFTALHEMQTRSSDENSVRLFVCPSVKCVDCDKTEEKSVQIFIPYERTFSLLF